MVRLFFFVLALLSPFSATAARLELEFTPPPERLYVGQAGHFQIKLYDRVGLTDIGIEPVDWPNTEVFFNQNGEQKDGEQVFDFILVVKAAGRAEFAPLCLTAFAPTLVSARDLPDFVQVSSDGSVRICTPAFTVDVQTLPAHSFPVFASEKAELLAGVQPKTPTVDVGTPIKRSVILTAKGTLSAFLPDLSVPETDTARLYAGKTERTMITSRETIDSALRQTFVYVPKQAGKLVLPAITVPWLNVLTNEIEEAGVPAYEITVTGGAVVPDKTELKPEQPVKAAPFPTAEVLGGTGVLLELFFIRRKRRPKSVEEAVVEACQADDAAKIEKALLAWAKSAFPDRKIFSLADVCRATAFDADFVREVRELERFLYSTGRFAKHLPLLNENIGKNVLQAFNAMKSNRSKPENTEKQYLPPLYPKD